MSRHRCASGSEILHATQVRTCRSYWPAMSMAAERLMYRLSRSDYRERFVLRGAWLFYLWGIPRRATRDVDFLAQVDNVHERAKEVFREVSQLDVSHNDGLHFDLDSIRV